MVSRLMPTESENCLLAFYRTCPLNCIPEGEWRLVQCSSARGTEKEVSKWTDEVRTFVLWIGDRGVHEGTKGGRQIQAPFQFSSRSF